MFLKLLLIQTSLLYFGFVVRHKMWCTRMWTTTWSFSSMFQRISSHCLLNGAFDRNRVLEAPIIDGQVREGLMSAINPDGVK